MSVLFCHELLPLTPCELSSEPQCDPFLYVAHDDESLVEETESRLPVSRTPLPRVETDTVTPHQQRSFGSGNECVPEDGSILKKASKRFKVKYDFNCNDILPPLSNRFQSRLPCNKNNSESFNGLTVPNLEKHKYDCDFIDLLEDIPELIPETRESDMFDYDQFNWNDMVASNGCSSL